MSAARRSTRTLCARSPMLEVARWRPHRARRRSARRVRSRRRVRSGYARRVEASACSAPTASSGAVFENGASWLGSPLTPLAFVLPRALPQTPAEVPPRAVAAEKDAGRDRERRYQLRPRVRACPPRPRSTGNDRNRRDWARRRRTRRTVAASRWTRDPWTEHVQGPRDEDGRGRRAERARRSRGRARRHRELGPRSARAKKKA